MQLQEGDIDSMDWHMMTIQLLGNYSPDYSLKMENMQIRVAGEHFLYQGRSEQYR